MLVFVVVVVHWVSKHEPSLVHTSVELQRLIFISFDRHYSYSNALILSNIISFHVALTCDA